MKNKINKNVSEAFKSQDKIALSLFRELKSNISVFEASGKTHVNASDKDVLKIINSVLKQHLESKEAYEKGNRLESVKDEERYIKMLQELLPPEISDNDLNRIMEEIFALIPPTKLTMGAIIKNTKEVLEKRGFKADGQKISEIVKSKIQ